MFIRLRLEWGLRILPAVPEEQGSIHSMHTVVLEPPVTPTSGVLCPCWTLKALQKCGTQTWSRQNIQTHIIF